MRNVLIVTVATLCFGFSLAGSTRAQDINFRDERRNLNALYKQDWNALKVRQKNQMQSLRGREVSPAVRAEAKHKMQRERRALRDKHKDEMQELKDRQRALRESQRIYGQ